MTQLPSARAPATRTSGYTIADEPSPSTLSHLVVQPVWPLFAIMFAGAWLAWPWFVLNGFAMGSPTRMREAAIAAAGFAGNLLFLVGVLVSVGLELVPAGAVPYLLIVFSAWKLLVSYAIFVTQARTFGLYEAFGGPVRNGAMVVFAGYLLRKVLTLPPLLLLVIA